MAAVIAEEVPTVVVHTEEPIEAGNHKTRQLNPINVNGDRFGSDSIVAQLGNLRISGDNEDNCIVVPQQPVVENTNGNGQLMQKICGRRVEDFVQHNNSVCVDFDSGAMQSDDIMNIVSEARDACKGADPEDDDDDQEEEEDDMQDDAEVNFRAKNDLPRESRRSEGDVVSGAAKEVLGKRVHNSKSMCDNDLRVDHLINKKDSMRIRFDDNGDAQIQKRDILHRKFYKSVDDELHKKAVASMNGKSQCMTLDRVFKKLRGQMRKLERG